MKALPFLRLQEAIETAAGKKVEEDREATLNALMAGRWIHPQKDWRQRLLDWRRRPEYGGPEMDEDEAVRRARELLAADRGRRGTGNRL